MGEVGKSNKFVKFPQFSLFPRFVCHCLSFVIACTAMEMLDLLINSWNFSLSSVSSIIIKGICSGTSTLWYSSTEIWIELEFGNVDFWGEGKTGVPGEKPLGAEKRTNNKLNPHIASSSRIDPEPYRWKASALTTAPSLLPFVINTVSRMGDVHFSARWLRVISFPALFCVVYRVQE